MRFIAKISIAITFVVFFAIDSFAQKAFEKDSLYTDPTFFDMFWIQLDSNSTKDVKSFSFDMDIKTTFPKDYHYCISLMNSAFNGRQFHTGLCTFTNGFKANSVNSLDTVFGLGAVFSRWFVKDSAIIKTDGYYELRNKSYDNYVSIRNKAIWGKGKYRVSVYVTGYTPGKPIPSQALKDKFLTPLTEYEHTWVTMAVENLKTHQKWVIGEMAFPGKKLTMSTRNQILSEHYNSEIYMGNTPKKFDKPVINYKDLPKTNIVVSNLRINDKVQKIDDGTQETLYKTKLGSHRFDRKKNLLYLETGVFNGWEVNKKK